jgi:hypothetical protein
MIHEKNLKQKILWHCPFLTFSFLSLSGSQTYVIKTCGDFSFLWAYTHFPIDQNPIEKGV